MNTNAKRIAGLVLLVGLGGPVFATQPPDVVHSDTSQNTAMGTQALAALTTGIENTAAGFAALDSNTTGDYNTAFGSLALASNTTGFLNIAIGGGALDNNVTGNSNTATGDAAMYENSSGSQNTATGQSALATFTGDDNTAIGAFALLGGDRYGVDGNYNTASGAYALSSITNGNNNIAQGYQAGLNLTTGSNNIYIGNEGAASESGIIRIGTQGTHTGTAIAGIYGSSVPGGVEVVVNSKGKLGVKTSARRYKDNIRGIGDSSDGLYQLRPVTFRYKESEPDGKKPVQYGLVAEEVAKVYPELIIRDERGEIQGVRYEELAPMLLNEMQKEHATVATLFSQHERDAAKLDSQAKKIASFELQLASIQAALVKLQPKDGLVAQR